VNALDGHPNELANRLVAEQVVRRFAEAVDRQPAYGTMHARRARPSRGHVPV